MELVYLFTYVFIIYFLVHRWNGHTPFYGHVLSENMAHKRDVGTAVLSTSVPFANFEMEGFPSFQGRWNDTRSVWKGQGADLLNDWLQQVVVWSNTHSVRLHSITFLCLFLSMLLTICPVDLFPITPKVFFILLVFRCSFIIVMHWIIYITVTNSSSLYRTTNITIVDVTQLTYLSRSY